MMRMPTYIATVKNANDAKVADHSLSANVFPQRLGMGVLGAYFFSTPFFLNRRRWPCFFGEHTWCRSMVALTKEERVTRRLTRIIFDL